jgi:hypothetical protein
VIRTVVANYLEDVTEREFDAPLLALLAAHGCSDIHFIHGAYEFGKDIIAKRVDPRSGVTFQLAIQSKAGDLNQAAWRAVRPQLDECGYNTRAHPSFDETLPRIAVLVTTGRLTGGAAVDAQEYKAVCQSRGLADVEFWDRETLVEWICAEPGLALVGSGLPSGLMSVLVRIEDHSISEPDIERYSRTWLEEGGRLARSALEASILGTSLREAQRLDLAALTCLHLLRATVVSSDVLSVEVTSAIKQLFCEYGREILDDLEPLLDDPRHLVEPMITLGAAATYPAACCRLAEIASLVALTAADTALSERGARAARTLAASHPGTRRPPSDAFAVSIIPLVCVLGQADSRGASDYLRDVAQWVLDRYDEGLSGLGLASIDESEEASVERLLGGRLSGTTLEGRRSSYLIAVVLDLLLVLGDQVRYEAVRDQVRALRVQPSMTYADESVSKWCRGGPDVWPQPNIGYQEWSAPRPRHHDQDASVSALDATLLTAVCRSRHSMRAVSDTLRHSPAG